LQARQAYLLVRWCAGALVCWRAGVLARWCAGALVRWCAGVIANSKPQGFAALLVGVDR